MQQLQQTLERGERGRPDVGLAEAQTLVMNARVLIGWVDPADLGADEAGAEGETDPEADAETEAPAARV